MILVGVFSDKMGDRIRYGRPTRFKALRVPNSQSLKE